MKQLVKKSALSLRAVVQFGINVAFFPVRLLRAEEQRSKLRSMDIALLRDVGMTQKDVDRVTLSDFMRNCRKD